MELFAKDGLRILVVAFALLDESTYESWNHRYADVSNDLKEIEKRRLGEANKIDDLMNEIECNLEILGATAIEDRLQDEVPQTIHQLKEANIKLWMLTGDKEETAINIGYSCRLLKENIKVVVISAETHTSADAIAQELKVLNNEDKVVLCQSPKASKNGPNTTAQGTPFAVVIDGEALEIALHQCKDIFVSVTTNADSVIACRVTPAQKAELVQMVKNLLPNVRTLAIGDGANDVSMIQAAHIGVGIAGQEGMQAANSSDYSIAQFRFLSRLLLVHGRWNYIRMAKLILYIFYKNVMMNLAQYWYMFYAGFSGQKFFLEWGLQGYNLFFTALPIVLVSVFEQDVPDYLAVNFSRLYIIGQGNKKFNTRIVWSWIVSCIWESVVISFGSIYTTSNLYHYGESTSMWSYGCTAFTTVILVVNLKLAIHQSYWHWSHFFVYFISFLLWIALASVISSGHYAKFSPYWSGIFGESFNNNGKFLIVIPFLVICALSRDFFWKGYNRAFHPTYNHLAQEVHSYGLNHIADELLCYPPPSEMPITENAVIPNLEERKVSVAQPVRVSEPEIHEKRELSTESMHVKRKMSRLSSLGENRRSFAFSYDAESYLAQSYLATDDQFTRKAFERHGSLGSLGLQALEIQETNFSFPEIHITENASPYVRSKSASFISVSDKAESTDYSGWTVGPSRISKRHSMGAQPEFYHRHISGRFTIHSSDRRRRLLSMASLTK